MVQTTAHRLQIGRDNWDQPSIGRFDEFDPTLIDRLAVLDAVDAIQILCGGVDVYRALSVHRISPRVRDDREAPLICRETGEVVRLIWVRTKAEYF